MTMKIPDNTQIPTPVYREYDNQGEEHEVPPPPYTEEDFKGSRPEIGTTDTNGGYS